jgi:hypothetical protein
MRIHIEHTDTFAGVSNYSWVRRSSHECNTPLQAVRIAKKFAQCTGMRTRKEYYGDLITLYPEGLCQVVFIKFDYD